MKYNHLKLVRGFFEPRRSKILCALPLSSFALAQTTMKFLLTRVVQNYGSTVFFCFCSMVFKLDLYWQVWVFALSLIGLIPLAERVSFLTE
jgi:hypothetical protein